MPLTTISFNNSLAGFKEIFESHYPSVCRRLTSLLGSRAAAEDVAQEAFIKLYEAPPRENSNLGGWLTRVATNMAYNHLYSEKSRRRREADAGRSLAAAEPEPGEELLRSEVVAFTRRVLELLPERDRACLLLKYSGMDYAAIARVIGVKESSVGTLLARARARFKSEYLKLGGSDHGVL
ncbi:RNA polymerase sigma factor SigX [Pelotomaculum propionicicum]|uniref:RNA polymerase sigma factor SigX n=1 Tax=Pelotomaculum propionicicum TaxID=258475 RepID=UPI003B7FB7B3